LVWLLERLASAKRLENVYRPIIRNVIGERLFIDQHSVIYADIDVPTKCATFIKYVIRESRDYPVDLVQDFGN